MEPWLNLIDETMSHLNEGAKSVRAHTNDKTFIITKAGSSGELWVTIEEPGFPKTKTTSLEPYFREVFGIEAKY